MDDNSQGAFMMDMRLVYCSLHMIRGLVELCTCIGLNLAEALSMLHMSMGSSVFSVGSLLIKGTSWMISLYNFRNGCRLTTEFLCHDSGYAS